MNELRLAMAACGLSQREAAALLEVRLDTVAKAMTGRSRTPSGWLADLRELNRRQQRAAEQAFQLWREAGEPKDIELGIASDDYEAMQLGWPCVGAQMAVFRMLWERLPADVRIAIVPRGSTMATAAAADAHE
ncbi:MAG TPA: hypothetical protein VF194_06365 [Ferrovibrio sp.]|uniref:hypothetical protein n=1 Tax=Ferrovibrio sp. TaxID=1917215 RepID=UPI002ED3A82C